MNLLKVLATVSSMTFVSRILGFIRDVLIARLFGAGLATDAFFVAFRIPNLLRRLFAEGAFSQAFVPVLSEYRTRRGDAETRLLVDRTATVSSMTFVSRILGFIRDVLIARLFGAGLATDAFFVAFRIPNLLRRLFAEGAFSQAFVPVLSEYRTRRGDAETRLLVDRTATL